MSASKGIAAPPLQAVSHLRLRALSCQDPAVVDSTLQQLAQYVATQSCNAADVDVLLHTREELRSTTAVDGAALKHAVEARADALRAVLERCREKASILLGSASSSNAAARASGAADANRAPTVQVVSWWQLSAASPWDFAVPAQREAGSQGGSGVDGYVFCCLKESVDIIQPFLDAMRCAAALGDEALVNATYGEGCTFLTRAYTRGDPVAVFAMLELARTSVALAFAGRGGVAAVSRALQACHAHHELRQVAEVLERVDPRDGQAQEAAHQPAVATDPAAPTQTRVQAYWGLALSYCVFFHTVTAYVDGVRGGFEAFASAVLGSGGEPELHLWGAARYPFIPFKLTEAGGANRRGGGGGVAAASTAAVYTRLAALFPLGGSHVTGSGSDWYLAEYRPLVATVMATAPAFSALLLLSAVATLPLVLVTQQLPLWAELHELYDGSEDLTALVRALGGGELGAVWRAANAAATAHLSDCPHLLPTTVQELLRAVRRAVCFHYMSARTVTHMAVAAQELGLSSADEFAEVAVQLIQDQYIDARIDLVDSTLHMQAAEAAGRSSGGGEGSAEATARAVLSLSALEMQLTCLAAERNLLFVPAA